MTTGQGYRFIPSFQHDEPRDKLSLTEREKSMADDIPHYSGFTPRPIERLISRHRQHTMIDKLSLTEREKSMADDIPHYSGFTPRPIERLISRHRQHTMIDIECCHFLRTPRHEFANQQPSVEYRLWIEAGKSPPPIPTHPDSSYNSNVWRNFRKHFGLNFSADGRKTSETIALMYPINIPAPSQVGEHTLEKFLHQSNLFENENIKNLAMKRSRTEVDEFKHLRCRTEARNPPLNEKGDILPPENFKKYAQRFVPMPSAPPTPPSASQKIDLFGQRYTPVSQPFLWKLTYKLNHPEYQKLREEVQRKREKIERVKQEKANNNLLPRVLTSPLLNSSP